MNNHFLHISERSDICKAEVLIFAKVPSVNKPDSSFFRASGGQCVRLTFVASIVPMPPTIVLFVVLQRR
jgi:hypothetical protein